METLIQVAGGVALLALGGEGVIRGAVGVARRLGVSELLIGLILVGFGTSTPELLTSLRAAVAGAPGIAVGNVVGSNISNALLIVAIATLVSPIAVSPAAIRRDGLIMLGVSALLVGLAITLGQLTRPTGAALVALLVAYSVAVWWTERRGGAAAAVHQGESHTHDPAPAKLGAALLFACGGLALLVFGADLLVKGAVTLARVAGLSETVIGLTIVAVGTSLPELVATLAAAMKGRSDVALGNILGSGIYNVLGILGVTALVHPIVFPADLSAIDWGTFVGSGALLLLFARTGARLSRLEGVVLLALYAGYVAYLLAR